MAPITFTAMTLNLWGDHHGEHRRAALERLFTVRPPDLLATQELRACSRAVADAALAGHERVDDGFAGWEHQSNLWWGADLFEEIEHGADDVGILAPDARLFWVRLGVLGEPGRSLLFATAHLTWPGHEDERADGVNRRIGQARAIVAGLDGSPAAATSCSRRTSTTSAGRCGSSATADSATASPPSAGTRR